VSEAKRALEGGDVNYEYIQTALSDEMQDSPMNKMMFAFQHMLEEDKMEQLLRPVTDCFLAPVQVATQPELLEPLHEKIAMAMLEDMEDFLYSWAKLCIASAMKSTRERLLMLQDHFGISTGIVENVTNEIVAEPGKMQRDKIELAVATFTEQQEAQARKIFDRYDLVSSVSCYITLP